MSDNNNKKPSKKPHQAKFLISKYLASQKSFEHKIDVYDVAILKVCADMMDRKENNIHTQQPEVKILYGYQETIATQARVTRAFLNRRFKKYIANKILKQITFFRGRSNQYAFGETIVPSIREALEEDDQSPKEMAADNDLSTSSSVREELDNDEGSSAPQAQAMYLH